MHFENPINLKRVLNRLQIMANIGAVSGGGVRRLALTDADRKARDMFALWSKETGCLLTFDSMGNQFACKKGSDPDLPAIMIFSHLDSQPVGGNFDGVLGIVAGFEIIERLQEENLNHKHSIVIVNWTNEEGSRFSPAMIGSGVYTGVFDISYAYSRTDKNGKKLGEELKRIGYSGNSNMEKKTYKACFELHIEQGPTLETSKTPIGIVTGVQGIRWYKLSIIGQEMHAGTFPVKMRNDPVQVLYEILEEIYNLADKYGDDSRITVGSILTYPDSINTVPALIEFTLDIRHPDQNVLKNMHKEINKISTSKVRFPHAKINLKELWYSKPVVFHDICIEAIQHAANKLQLPARKIISGAGHDAVNISRIAPTGMIFIPCKDGISHSKAEHAKEEDIMAGVTVLYEAVKSLI